MKNKIFIAIVVAILAISSVSVMAADSPVVKDTYNVTVGGKTVGKKGASVSVKGGTIDISTGTVTEGKQVTLTATANNGYTFSKWVIDGDYEIVSGSLTSTTITIIPGEDIDIDAEFVDANGKTTTGGNGGNTSVTSPKTGLPVGAIAVTLLLAGGVAITTRKKIFE